MRSGRFPKIEQICNPIFFKGKNMNTLHLFAKTFLLVSLLVSSAAFATTYYIDTDGNDLNAGTSWATAFKTIQRGVNVSANGDVVEVNEGTYSTDVTIYAKNITLKSINPKNVNIVEATVINAGVEIQSNDSTLEGFKIINDSVTVLLEYSSALIQNCILESSSRENILVYYGAPIIRGNTIRNSSIGIYFMQLEQGCYIVNNFIHGCRYGILLSASNSQMLIRNNTIISCTLNGIYVAPYINDNYPNIRNCIIWDCNDDLYNCSATYSCISDSFDSTDPNFFGSINSDPCFVDADANNFHLWAGSLCINAGDPNFSDANEVDIDGDPRILNGRVDIGADESIVGDIIIFRIRNVAGDDIAWIDRCGNMALRGTITPNTIPYATVAKEFRFQNVDGNDAAIINAKNGNVFIRGMLYERQATLTLSGSNNFIIKDSNGTVVAYINNAGDLYLKGSLYENYLEKKRVSVLTVTDSNNVITAVFDNFGNLSLNGVLDVNTVPAATLAKELRVRDCNSNDIAIINADNGNMFIYGFLYQNQNLLEPTAGSGSLIIKDEEGDIVSYINNYGDLYLKGTLQEQQ
jgi:parallel beta-helix repeat protein